LYKDIKTINNKIFCYDNHALPHKSSYYNHLNIVKHPMVSSTIEKYLLKCIEIGNIK
jgi:hypothetical protein